MVKTFAERIHSISPQLKYQGLFHGYNVKKHEEVEWKGYLLTVKLKSDQVPDLERMKLTYIRKHFAAKGYGSLRDVNARDKQQIQELMDTTIVKDLGVIQFYFPNKIYFDFSSYGSRIFADPNVDLSEYKEIIENQEATFFEVKTGYKSNVNQRFFSDSIIRSAFPNKLESGGIVILSGGRWSSRKKIRPEDYYVILHRTDELTNVKTFEVLGKTKSPGMRQVFVQLLPKF